MQARALCWLPHTHLAGCWPQPQPHRLINSFFVSLNFHAACSFQLCCQAGTGCRQVSPPLQPHASPVSRAKLHPHHLPPVSCCPLLHLGHKILLVLLLFVPGLNMLRLPPAQGFTASPAWTAHMTPHCCSSMSPGTTMPWSHLRRSRQLPATPSCSCPDGAGDLSQVPPLRWKTPKLGSCKASSKPHSRLDGHQLPVASAEAGSLGLCCQPWVLSILVPTRVKGGGWLHTASRCSL